MQQVQSLQKISKSEVYPSQSSSNKLLLPQNSIQFLEMMLKSFHAFPQCLFEGELSVVIFVYKLNVGWVQVFIDAICSRNAHFFFCASAIEFRFCLVAEMNADRITFSDHLISIDQVRQSHRWIFVKQLRLDLIKPLRSSLRSRVSLLFVRYCQVLQQLSDSLGQASHVPIPESDCRLFHKIFIISIAIMKRLHSGRPINRRQSLMDRCNVDCPLQCRVSSIFIVSLFFVFLIRWELLLSHLFSIDLTRLFGLGWSENL